MPLQDLPDGGRGHRNTEAGQLPRDPPVPPVLVVSGHPQHEPGDRGMPAGPAGLLPPGLRRPTALDQIPVPTQDRRGHNRQAQPGVARPRHHRQQRREQRPIGPGQLRLGGAAALEERDLMSQQQDLRVLPRRGPPRQPQPTLAHAGQGRTVGSPGGVSPPGSHGSRREPLDSPGSCHSGHQTAGTVLTQAQWAKNRGRSSTARFHAF